MAWIYLDDRFPEHPKVLRAGGDAAWLFVCSLAWCRRHKTAGLVPSGAVRVLSDRPNAVTLAKRLVEAGLWETADGGYQIHDYDDWNRTEVLQRASSKARTAATAKWDRVRQERESECSEDADDHPPAMLQACSKHPGRMLGASAMHNGSSPEADAEQSASFSPAYGRARPSPNPLTPVVQVVQEPPPVQPAGVGGDGFAELLEGIAAVELRETLRAGGKVGNPDAWKRTVVDRYRTAHGSRLLELARSHPDRPVEWLRGALIGEPVHTTPSIAATRVQLDEQRALAAQAAPMPAELRAKLRNRGAL